jgi:hypothetical protein
MGFLHALHGEIAGLYATFFPNPESITNVGGYGTFIFGKRGTWAYTPRTDANGNGGNYALVNTGYGGGYLDASFKESGIPGKTAVEMFCRMPLMKMAGSSVTHQVEATSSAAAGFHWVVDILADGTIRISTNGTVRTTIASIIPDAANKWPVLTVWAKIDAVNGWVRVYKDYNYGTPLLEWDGIVYYSTWGPPANADKIRYVVDGYHNAIDDVKWNDVTMSYSGGTGGPPSVGDTIEGDVSGSTATITRVDGTATAGTLQLTSLLDAGVSEWNGKQADDPFAGDASISTSGGWAANLVNAGLDPDSGLPGDSFFAPAMLPNGNGFVNDLTEEPVQAGGSEWKVYIYDGSGGSTPLGFGPSAEVSYGYADSTTKQVLVDVAAFSIDPADVDGIVQLHVYAWAKKDGAGIDDIQLNVRHGSTTGTGDTQVLGSSYDAFVQRFRENPDTAAPWDAMELATVQIGVGFPA